MKTPTDDSGLHVHSVRTHTVNWLIAFTLRISLSFQLWLHLINYNRE